MPAKKSSSPPPVEKSALEKYPDFTKKILEHLSKLPANDFIEFLITIFGENSVVPPKGFEKNVVEAMRLLEIPAPEQVVDFLFSSVEDETFSDDNTYASAIQILDALIDKKDKLRLIRAIASYLCSNLDNKQREIVGILQNLTFDLK
jgi:hypothetical protein